MKVSLIHAASLSLILHLGIFFWHQNVSLKTDLASLGQRVPQAQPIQVQIRLASNRQTDHKIEKPKKRKEHKPKKPKSQTKETPLEIQTKAKPKKQQGITSHPAQAAPEPTNSVNSEPELPSTPTAPLKTAQKQSAGMALIEANYLSEVRTWLERHKFYPKRARRMSIEGRVRVRFQINQDGDLLTYSVVEEAEHAIFNKAAIKALRKAAPMPRIPNDLNITQMELEVPFDYALR